LAALTIYDLFKLKVQPRPCAWQAYRNITFITLPRLMCLVGQMQKTTLYKFYCYKA